MREKVADLRKLERVGQSFVATDERGGADNVGMQNDGQLASRSIGHRDAPFIETSGSASRPLNSPTCDE